MVLLCAAMLGGLVSVAAAWPLLGAGALLIAPLGGSFAAAGAMLVIKPDKRRSRVKEQGRRVGPDTETPAPAANDPKARQISGRYA